MLTVLFFISTEGIQAQARPEFWNDIQSFKKQDSISPPPQKAILFVGSSSFTLWKNVQVYFPEYPLINRGFGGSSLVHLIQYANDIIYPYNPKQIVIYAGENDLAASDTVTGETVFNRFKQLYGMIRSKLGKVNVVYVSIKPSPSRQHLMPKMKEANKLIRDFMHKQKRTSFIDVYSLMIGSDGNPKKELFLEDRLHMNEEGYEIWADAIRSVLIE